MPELSSWEKMSKLNLVCSVPFEMKSVFKRKSYSNVFQACIHHLHWLVLEILMWRGFTPFCYHHGNFILRMLSSLLLCSLHRSKDAPRGGLLSPTPASLSAISSHPLPFSVLYRLFAGLLGLVSLGKSLCGSPCARAWWLAHSPWSVSVKTLWSPQGQLASNQGQSSCINSAWGSSSIQWSWLCGVWN